MNKIKKGVCYEQKNLNTIEEVRKFQRKRGLPSKEQIGQPVWIKLNGVQLTGNIRVITFSNMKVRYGVSIIVDGCFHDGARKKDSSESRTTFHNIDGVFIKDRDGDWVDFGDDNYS